MPGFPVYYLLEFAQAHVHWVSDVVQPSHHLSSPSPPALDVSQHQDLFQWVGSSHQVAKVLELQFQHQSFQWICRTDLLCLIIMFCLIPQLECKLYKGRNFLKIYLFLSIRGLCCCLQPFFSCGEWGLLFIAVASLVAEYGLCSWGTGA